MKLTCLKDNLVKKLGIVSKAIPLKHSYPILTNVLIRAKDGSVKLYGTDFNTSIIVNVGASVEEDGAIAVPSRLLSEYLSHLSTDTVSLNLENDILHLVAGKTKSKFNGISAEDYPEIASLSEDVPYIRVNAKAFAQAVSQVGFSVAADETRPVFAGIYLKYSEGKLTLAGSDGFRLSEKIIAAECEMDSFSVIVPAKVLLETARIFSSFTEDIKIYFSENENLVFFECDDILVVSRVIEGSYPDYHRIIPQDSAVTVEFNPADLLEAVRLTNVFAKEEGRDAESVVTMSISPEGGIKIFTTSKEYGENSTEFSASVIGEALDILFKPKFMLDFLTNAKYEKVIFHAKDAKAPCLIRPIDDDTFLHVIAPMNKN